MSLFSARPCRCAAAPALLLLVLLSLPAFCRARAEPASVTVPPTARRPVVAPGASAAAPVCDRVRLFPRAGFAARLIRGKIQGSNAGPTSGFVDLATINAAPPEGKWLELRFSNKRAYRFLRYFGPNDSFGNIAEIAFYAGDAKIAGTSYGTAGSRGEGGNIFAKALDGDTSTFFDAPLANAQYVGIEVEGRARASAAAAAQSPGAGGYRHYHVGNSLTDTEGELAQALAQAAGFNGDFFDRQTIPGAPLRVNWEASGGFGTPYREAFTKHAPLDGLVLQTFIQNGDSDDPTYSLRFHDLARQSGSPDVQPWIYGQWPATGTGRKDAGAPEWELATGAYMRTYAAHALNFRRERPQVKPALVIPGGLALVQLKRAVEMGRVPGMTNFFAGNFEDDLHLNGNGRYFIGLVHYCCFYRRSPVGLPIVRAAGVSPTLSPAQARVYQQVAWETVQEFSRAPETLVGHSVPGQIDARAHTRDAPPYRSSMDVRFINAGSRYDYLVAVSKTGAYRLSVSVANTGDAPKPLEIHANGALVHTVQAPPTPKDQPFTDTVPVTLNLPAGLNLVGLRVPDNRPYDLNALTVTDAASRGVANTLPTTDFYAFEPGVKPGEAYSKIFNVRDAQTTDTTRIQVAARSDNPALVPDANITIAEGDFAGEYGQRGNRRLVITPAPGQTGQANITLTITDAGGLARSLRFRLSVK